MIEDNNNTYKSNLESHLEREFALLPEDAIIHEFKPEVLALVRAFGNSGQSGGSAPITAKVIISVISKLLTFRPLSPLTGADGEWRHVDSPEESPFEQNVRCSAVFREPCGKVVMLGSIVWEEPDGACFQGKVNGISSVQRIILPCHPPEPVYVRVVPKEDGGYDIADPAPLREVLERLDWIPWSGGENPIPNAGPFSFEVKLRSGRICWGDLLSTQFNWKHVQWCPDMDIVAYRVLEGGAA